MALYVGQLLATELVKELDTCTPCIIHAGNAKEKENLRRTNYLVAVILQVADSHFSQKQKNKIVEALYYAAENHRGKYRDDGFTPYFLHVLEVVYILIKQRVLDYKVIVAAIIHDLVEDTPVTRNDVRKKFGYAISQIVHFLTKSKDREKRKLYWSIIRSIKDRNILWRVIAIKFADRIHNMSTLRAIKEIERRKRKIEETAREFPKLYKILVSTLRELRNDGVFKAEKHIHLPFHLNNRLHYEMEMQQ